METFVEWVKSRKPGPVELQADKVFHLIQQAGPHGLSYGKLAANVTLEPDTIAAVLQALVDFGQVVVSMEGDQRIYRCR